MFKILQGVLDQLWQVIGQVSVRDALQVVVVGILCETPVDERPSQVVHRVLLVLYGFGHNLRVEVIVKPMI